jgi:hypothetical protein
MRSATPVWPYIPHGSVVLSSPVFANQPAAEGVWAGAAGAPTDEVNADELKCANKGRLAAAVGVEVPLHVVVRSSHVCMEVCVCVWGGGGRDRVTV